MNGFEEKSVTIQARTENPSANETDVSSIVNETSETVRVGAGMTTWEGVGFGVVVTRGGVGLGVKVTGGDVGWW